MRVTFVDLENESNRLNGSVLAREEELADLLTELAARSPFVFELRGENGYMLQIGIARAEGCVQHSPVNGDVPYMMALASNRGNGDDVEFALGGTPTPISRRYIMPLERVREIVLHFVQTGNRGPMVGWEEI
jgi:hypothetical protein